MTPNFDYASVLQTTIDKIFTHAQVPPVPIIPCTDSRLQYECLGKLKMTNKKRLLIDRHFNKPTRSKKLGGPTARTNPTDAMTKSMACNALQAPSFKHRWAREMLRHGGSGLKALIATGKGPRSESGFFLHLHFFLFFPASHSILFYLLFDCFAIPKSRSRVFSVFACGNPLGRSHC